MKAQGLVIEPDRRYTVWAKHPHTGMWMLDRSYYGTYFEDEGSFFLKSDDHYVSEEGRDPAGGTCVESNPADMEVVVVADGAKWGALMIGIEPAYYIWDREHSYRTGGKTIPKAGQWNRVDPRYMPEDVERKLDRKLGLGRAANPAPTGTNGLVKGLKF